MPNRKSLNPAKHHSVATVPEVTPARLPPTDKMFLTIKEASQVSGLSQKYLQDLVQSGSLKSIPDTLIKIRRSDLGTIS